MKEQPLPFGFHWAKSLNMKRILTVDDNELVQEILEPMLDIWAEEHLLSIEITTASNGKEALSWINQHGVPDLVLLDVRMPIMDGAEFLRQTALLGLDIKPLTLLLTGYADDLEEHLGTDALLMKHLRKPFTAPELFQALDKLASR